AALASGVPGVKRVFGTAHFHEIVLSLPKSSTEVLARMAAQGVSGGFDLQPHYTQLGNAILVCATETKTDDDLQRFVAALRHALN
ncbi:MAG: glycine dehydrogenase, partial [Gallionella sp.]|nr:glycine dehydrogenase [Gallionella sp.]